MCLVTICAGIGCEGPPARSKSWRTVGRLGAAADDAARPATAESPEAGPPSAPSDDDARRARTLRIQLPVEPASLDPLGSGAGPDREMLEVTEDTIFETLVRHTASGYLPELAESFRVTDGGFRDPLRPPRRRHLP